MGICCSGDRQELHQPRELQEIHIKDVFATFRDEIPPAPSPACYLSRRHSQVSESGETLPLDRREE